MSSPSISDVDSSSLEASAVSRQPSTEVVHFSSDIRAIAPVSGKTNIGVDSSTPGASEAESMPQLHCTDDVDSATLDASLTAVKYRSEATVDLRTPACASTTTSSEVNSEIPVTSETSISRTPLLSSIEHDPDNPPPETPPRKKRVTVYTKVAPLTLREKFYIQLPIWDQHGYNYSLEILVAGILSCLALTCCFVAYVMDMKAIFFGIASGLIAMCFTLVWLWIAEGPPLLCDPDGNGIHPDYVHVLNCMLPEY